MDFLRNPINQSNMRVAHEHNQRDHPVSVYMSHSVSPNDELIRSPEVRRIAEVSRSTLWRWIRANRFPAPLEHWPGRRLVWRRDDVTNFVNGSKK